jgi:hypothetical protein
MDADFTPVIVWASRYSSRLWPGAEDYVIPLEPAIRLASLSIADLGSGRRSSTGCTAKPLESLSFRGCVPLE